MMRVLSSFRLAQATSRVSPGASGPERQVPAFLRPLRLVEEGILQSTSAIHSGDNRTYQGLSTCETGLFDLSQLTRCFVDEMLLTCAAGEELDLRPKTRPSLEDAVHDSAPPGCRERQHDGARPLFSGEKKRYKQVVKQIARPPMPLSRKHQVCESFASTLPGCPYEILK